ncbi:adenosylcobinamide-phosphate synthase CbiB [Microvirga pudoricolor]|uniref:adenosylcobinamide-phosphate synthase CbiB n=1 Tax=Microvirga pudoricolor TaxID=2778729 RepID=UPI001E58BC7B|nr:adenosylcobinamide-phosphate synthase CbiB [Microvirga pudoricolor]
MTFVASLSVTLLAIAAEAAFGYPKRLFGWIGHPVTWIGGLIGRLDTALNRPEREAAARRRRGVVALAIVLMAAVGTALLGQAALVGWLGAWAIVPLGLAAGSLIAQRSLHEHVAAVAAGLDRSLADGRAAVSQIVGRDPQSLDEGAVSRAAIESLAENFSDGIVAPVLFTALGGLPGGVFYKAVNTADSMIGHRTPRHEAYGWSAARLDDVVNLPASRLSALLIVAAALLLPGCRAGDALRAVRRDARHHRSPNAGWPESAVAGALGLRLAGPRTYAGVPVHDHWMGDGRPDAGPGDIRRALRLYRTACLLQAALVAALLLVVWALTRGSP